MAIRDHSQTLVRGPVNAKKGDHKIFDSPKGA